MRRLPGSTNQAPTSTNASSGTSFAAVDHSTSRAPQRRPRTLTATSVATSSSVITTGHAAPSSPSSRAAVWPSSAAIAPPAVTVATARSTPVTNPKKEPSPTSTYAYGPPVIVTRLPASMNTMTTSAITVAQTRYASGAAVPSCATAMAGSTKMPLPTV